MILLVDDEEGILEVCREILERCGYRAVTARSGEEALEVYRTEREGIELVFLDLHMPGMGGRSCLRALLEMEPAIKVVVATGHTSGDEAREALEMGAVRFVPKPYRLADMVGVVREALASEGAGGTRERS